MGTTAGEAPVGSQLAAGLRWGRLVGYLLAVASVLALFTAPVASADPGEPDLSFGSGGWASVPVDPGAEPVLRDLVRLPDGKLLAGGGSGGSGAGILTRFLADGALDETFGSQGIVRTERSLWAKLMPQADGKIVAFGSSGRDAAVARFNPDGTLDAGFGQGGIRVLDVRGQFRKTEASLEARGAGVDSQGRIVAVVWVGSCSLDDEGIDNVKSFGWTSDLCGDTAIVRLTSSGDLDPAFGDGDGIRIVTPGGKQIVATLAPDDGILITSVLFEDSGDVDLPNQSFRILRRLGPDGLPDTAFGDASWVSFEGELEYPMAGLLDVADDGTITATFGSSAIRLRKDGTPDGGFGDAGELRFETFSRASRLGLSPTFGDGAVTDRHIYLAGSSGGRKKAAGRRAVVARLNLDGRLDPTFSNDGLAVTRIGEALPEKMIDRRVGMAGGALLVDERGRAIIGVTGGTVGDLRFAFGRFQGGEGRRLSCNGVPATVQGTPGDDVLIAGEVTATGTGDDTVKRGGALICTGPGDDRVEAGDAGKVWLGAGDDTFSTTRMASLVQGQAGDDRILGRVFRAEGGQGDDLIDTTRFADRSWDYNEKLLIGGPGNDRIFANHGEDRLLGGAGADTLKGGLDEDRLEGGPGADSLFGGKATDVLIGGPGRDRLHGGPPGPAYHRYRIKSRKAKGLIELLPGRVGRESLKFRSRCHSSGSGKTRTSWTTSGVIFKGLKVRNGRFHGKVDNEWWDGSSEQERTSGVVRARSMTISVDIQYGYDFTNCWTGKLKLTLRRIKPAKQVVRQ